MSILARRQRESAPGTMAVPTLTVASDLTQLTENETVEHGMRTGRLQFHAQLAVEDTEKGQVEIATVQVGPQNWRAADGVADAVDLFAYFELYCSKTENKALLKLLRAAMVRRVCRHAASVLGTCDGAASGYRVRRVHDRSIAAMWSPQPDLARELAHKRAQEALAKIDAAAAAADELCAPRISHVGTPVGGSRSRGSGPSDPRWRAAGTLTASLTTRAPAAAPC